MIRQLLIILLVSLFAACGAESTSSTPTAEDTAASPPKVTAEAANSPSPQPATPTPQQDADTSGAWQIAVASTGFRSPDDGHEQITLVNTDGSGVVNLSNHTGNHHSPAWSPDGERIVFVSDRDGYLELYVIDADGSNLQRVTNNDFTEELPNWSPDGTRLVFACYPTREYGGQLDSQICTINVDGSGFRNLSEGNVHGYDPVWSPVGEQIAFVGMSDESFDQIYVVDSDGSNLRQLTSDQHGSRLSPDWSPDGRSLVYVASTIQIVDVESGDIHGVTNGPERYDNAPDWSPDGKQIAFIEEGKSIMVVNADGSSLHKVADNGLSLGPSWSPDSRQIAFISANVEPSALFVVDADGSNLTEAMDGASPGYPGWVPAWCPQPVDPADLPSIPTPELAPTVVPTDVSALAEIYAHAAESLQQPGMLYHQTVTLTTDAGLYSQQGTFEVWVDVERNVARLELRADMTKAPEPASFDTTLIVIGEARYSVYREPDQRVDTGTASTCYGVNQAVVAVLGCPGPLEESTTTLEPGEYDGQPAIVLVKTGTSRGSDESYTLTERFYLDAESYLPLARETEGTLDYGTTVPVRGLDVYRHEFIPLDAVPADFFDVPEGATP